MCDQDKGAEFVLVEAVGGFPAKPSFFFFFPFYCFIPLPAVCHQAICSSQPLPLVSASIFVFSAQVPILKADFQKC